MAAFQSVKCLVLLLVTLLAMSATVSGGVLGVTMGPDCDCNRYGIKKFGKEKKHLMNKEWCTNGGQGIKERPDCQKLGKVECKAVPSYCGWYEQRTEL
ncbi:hypothetical protein CYMTET_44135 [Cymbomonas tetramitiformis]|uniref:Uncharacterized protein n=1 Tax=Cymbomonas tetramitiformis TaxID=36881 RepID=A0AAE0EZW4_9CHLO|nr:hypothetical protein CYMTET_44135 [Cymbomonas tetramitiformis]